MRYYVTVSIVISADSKEDAKKKVNEVLANQTTEYYLFNNIEKVIDEYEAQDRDVFG